MPRGKARARPGEFELIETIFAPLSAGYPLAFDLTDDAALLRPKPGKDLVLTKDVIVEGVHFLGTDPADLVARKLLRVNLSDLAAKGATPVGYLLGAILPETVDLPWLRAFAKGFAKDQALFGGALIGGDTVATPGPLALSLTAIGEVKKGRAILRSGAKVGDGVFVTGTIGDGMLGLAVAKGGAAKMAKRHAAYLKRRYQLPEPRLGLGQRLAGLANAAVDVSDGLIADLDHICATSGVGARIEAGRVPLSPAAKAALASGGVDLPGLLSGGDDYEVLFTAPRRKSDKIEAAARASGIPVTRIGEIAPGQGVTVIGADGATMKIAKGGYRHF